MANTSIPRRFECQRWCHHFGRRPITTPVLGQHVVCHRFTASRRARAGSSPTVGTNFQGFVAKNLGHYIKNQRREVLAERQCFLPSPARKGHSRSLRRYFLERGTTVAAAEQ